MPQSRPPSRPPTTVPKLSKNGCKMTDSDNILHDDINFIITNDKFYAVPRSGSEVLVIDRLCEEVRRGQSNEVIPAASIEKRICGILGTIQLLSGRYLLVATERASVGTIAGHTIWRLVNFELIPYHRTNLHLTNEQIINNKTYLSMVETVLNTPYFYFSYTYDLTHTLQRLHNTSPDFLQMSIVDRADARFIWNGELLKDLNRPGLHRFCLPILHGFISINVCLVNSYSFTWSLISRRSIQRAGTRLYRRGINGNGHVANFVETEQIVEYNGERASYVQTRGSIPLFWDQSPDLRYKPPPTLLSMEDHMNACEKHFDSQVMIYGRQVCVNLIDHRGPEKVLEEVFRSAITQMNNPNVRYEAFDFHAECRHMRWDRLSILLMRLAHEQDDFSWFLLTRDGTLVSIQDGVFRTNCIDCLDRTNVVQSMLARRALTNILLKLNILKPGQTVEDQITLEMLFKSVWADNADYVSIQYSGTGALKTDFTRTGKRTRLGALRDGVNSLTRYYKNNFADGYRQDAIDLFLGNYKVVDGEGAIRACPLQVDKGWKYFTFPSVLLVAVAMFVACGVLPSEYSTETLIFLLFWGSMVIATGTMILHYGKEFVDKPKLC